MTERPLGHTDGNRSNFLTPWKFEGATGTVCQDLRSEAQACVGGKHAFVDYFERMGRHEWFYFPDMQVNEVLLIKTYDSMEDGRARFTIHTAFDDPTAAADAPPRESIETRAFAFFRD